MSFAVATTNTRVLFSASQVRNAPSTRRVAPAWAVPIHWGTLWPVGCQRIRPDRFHGPGEEFAGLVAGAAPATQVRVLAPGGTLALDDAPASPPDGGGAPAARVTEAVQVEGE